MDLPVSSWYHALFQRHSRRSFMADRPLTGDQTLRLERFAREFRPYPEARLAFVPEPPDPVLSGIVGSYGKISGARAYAAMIGREGAPQTAERVGYTGEGLILEATAMGLGTCWVSGLFRPEAVRDRLGIDPGERVYAVTPIGYATRDLTAKDRLFNAFARSAKRKPLAELIRGGPPAGWQEKALEAARIAPSAANRQPWRFLVEEGAITIFVARAGRKGRYSKRLDCGIAMLHLETGALAAGARGRWIPLEPPDVARFIT